MNLIMRQFLQSVAISFLWLGQVAAYTPPDNLPRSIAILGISTDTMIQEGGSIAEQTLGEELQKTGLFQARFRAELVKILSEKGLQKAAPIDEFPLLSNSIHKIDEPKVSEYLQRSGKLLNTELVLFGRIGQIGEQFQMGIVLYDVQNDSCLSIVNASGSSVLDVIKTGVQTAVNEFSVAIGGLYRQYQDRYWHSGYRNEKGVFVRHGPSSEPYDASSDRVGLKPDTAGPILLSGNYVDGIPTGVWIGVFEKTNSKAVEMQYQNGKVNGTKRLWYADGPLMAEVEFRNGLADGLARKYYKSGNIEVSTHLKKGVLVYERCKAFYEDGSVRMERTDTAEISYYPTGELEEFYQIRNGVRSGAYRMYSDKGGVVLSGAYFNGKPHGKWIDRNAESQVVVRFSKGFVRDSLVEYCANGRILQRFVLAEPLQWSKSDTRVQIFTQTLRVCRGLDVFKMGQMILSSLRMKLNATQTVYNCDGNLAYQIEFKDNKRSGDFTYYVGGKPFLDGQFYDDNPVLTWTKSDLSTGETVGMWNFRKGTDGVEEFLMDWSESLLRYTDLQEHADARVHRILQACRTIPQYERMKDQDILSDIRKAYTAQDLDRLTWFLVVLEHNKDFAAFRGWEGEDLVSGLWNLLGSMPVSLE